MWTKLKCKLGIHNYELESLEFDKVEMQTMVCQECRKEKQTTVIFKRPLTQQEAMVSLLSPHKVILEIPKEV